MVNLEVVTCVRAVVTLIAPVDLPNLPMMTGASRSDNANTTSAAVAVEKQFYKRSKPSIEERSHDNHHR